MTDPTTLVQLSDLHMRTGENRRGPAARLEQAMSSVEALRPQPCAMLLSGDLVDEPSVDAYRRVHEILAASGIPLYAIPGNHDDRDQLRDRFGPGPAATGAPVRWAVNCGPLRMVGCDSTIPGRESGALSGEQLDWLEHTLAQEPQAPTLLALHHPPVLTGVHSMDAIALDIEDSASLEVLLGRHPQVQAITCGHVHTTMMTAFAGRPLLICPSTNSALRLDLRAEDDIPFAVAEQPLGFALHALVASRLVSHVQPLNGCGRTQRSLKTDGTHTSSGSDVALCDYCAIARPWPRSQERRQWRRCAAVASRCGLEVAQGWQTDGWAAFDELENAHRAVGGAKPGRRFLTQQLNTPTPRCSRPASRGSLGRYTLIPRT